MNAKLALVLTLLSAGCTDADSLLLVDLRTDFVPGAEFVLVQSRLEPIDGGRPRTAMFGALRGADFVTGARVGDFDEIAPGRYRLEVSLYRIDGQVAVTRTTELLLGENYAVTVVATRSCASIVCGEGETCSSGRCVDDRCSPESLDDCGEPACRVDTDCPAPIAACAEARCRSGECFAVERADATCGPTAFCQPETMCIEYPDLPDAGPPDGGVDDAGPADAGPLDAGTPPGSPPVLINPTRGDHHGRVTLTPRAGATAPSTGRPKFQWGGSRDTLWFHLQVSQDETFDALAIDEQVIIGNSWTAAAGSAQVLTAPGKYFWRVTSCNDAGCAEFGLPSYFWLGRVREDIDHDYDGVGSVLVGAPLAGQTETGGGTLHRGEVSAYSYDSTLRRFVRAGIVTVDSNGDSATELGASIAVGHYDGSSALGLIAGGPARDGVGQVFAYEGGGFSIATGFPVLQGGAVASTQFGESLALADFDGDGQDDLLVGHPGDGATGGRVIVYWTSSAATPIEETRSSILPSPGTPWDRFGGVVATIGDVDSNGYVDFAVGAPNTTSVGANAGRVYVYYGGPEASVGGMLALGMETLSSPRPEDEEKFGASIAGIGDVNHDGYDDMIVGAPGHSATRGAGSAYIFFGSARGVGRELAPLVIDHPEPVADARFGDAVAGGGDIDGNGYADFVISAPEDAGGRVFVYRVFAGDPFVVPAYFELVPTTRDPMGRYGASLALSVDRSGDGYADVVVGAPQGVNRGPGGMARPTGYVDVWFGTPEAAPSLGATIWGEGTVGDPRYVYQFGRTTL